MNINDLKIVTELVEIVDIFIRRYTIEHPVDRKGNLHNDMTQRLDNIKKLLDSV